MSEWKEKIIREEPYGIGNELMHFHYTGEEIVRCRDCEHFGMFKPNKRYKAAPSCCKFQITLPDSDGFCAWGERKDESTR